jgi:hypothetical protein
MVHEELAAALGVEPSRGKTVGGFSRQIQSYGLDDRISNQEAVCSLNPFGIRSPMFLNCPRDELRTDDHDRGA